MDTMTFFVGVIAFCVAILTVALVVFLILLSRSVRSIDSKVSLLVYELSRVLPHVRKTTENIAGISSMFNVFSFFKKLK